MEHDQIGEKMSEEAAIKRTPFVFTVGERVSSTRLLVLMLVILAAMCLLALVASAQVPRTISYQGVLSTNGAPATGNHLITVALYDSVAGGSLLYQESHELTVTNGLFEMEIGSIVPIPVSLAFDRPYFLGVSIDGNPELAPRVPLDAAPYAIASGTAQLAEGLTPNAHGVVTSINELAGPIRITGDSITTVTEVGNDIIIHAQAAGAPSGIHSVSSPDKTIAIANSTGPIVSVGVADSAITTAKLADASVTPEKLARAGAKPGQVLKWNGNAWSIANDSIGASYTAGQGVSISGDTINATGAWAAGTVLNSTLRWNGSAWVENQNMTSDANGNTHINGATNLGDGIGADNITMNPGTGHVQVSGWNQGVVVSSPAGILSTSQLTGGLGVSITQNANTITIADSSVIGWGLVGNTSTSPPANFLGTNDNQPFEIHVNNDDGIGHGSKRVERFEPNATSANIIAGYQGNAVTPGVVGATISGGGLNGFNNTVTDDFGTVGGGSFNRTGNNVGSAQDASHATVAGGGGNTASGMYASVLGGTANTSGGMSATVGGGSTNQAAGAYATVMGGIANVAADTAAIVGGWSNFAGGTYSTISGGLQNGVMGSRSAIAGGAWLGLGGAGSFGFHNGTGILDSAYVAAPGTAFFGNVNLWLGNTNNTPGQLRLYGPQNGGINFPSPYTHYSSLSASGQTADINYILPSAPPNSVQVLAATGVTGSGPYTVTLGWSNSDGNAWSLTGNAGTTPTANFLGTTDNKDFVIKTNSIEAMRVASNGNVGIGTQSPGQKLSVVDMSGADPVIFENNNSTTGLNQQSALTLENLTPTSATTEIVFGHANLSGMPWAGATIDMLPVSLSPGSERGSLVFGTNNTGGTTVTERMRLTNTGFLGIGTSSPLQKLNLENGNVLLSRTGTNVNDTLEFQGNTTGYSTFAAGAQGATTINYTLPALQPMPNQVLTATSVTGAGPYNVTLGWAMAGGGSAWNLTGNSGTTPGTNFLGTTDNQAFEVHVNATRALRIEPNPFSPNIIAGSPDNSVSAGVTGATIAGGGRTGGQGNSVTGDYGTVGGGWDNQAGNEGTVGGGSGNAAGADAVVSGGDVNRATGTESTVSGGRVNNATGFQSTVGGGGSNAASGNNSTVAGGGSNAAIGGLATVGGGSLDSANGSFSTVSGGAFNTTNGTASAIPGGDSLRVGSSSFGMSVPGGSSLSSRIDLSSFSNLAYFGNMDLWLGNTDNTARALRFYAPSSSASYTTRPYSAFLAGSQTATINYMLPTSQPSANQVLSATSISGSGPYNVTLGWATAGSISAWNLTGNSGTSAGTNFIGTTDNTSFTIRANNLQAVQIQPSHSAPANFVGGGAANTIASGDTASFLGFGDSNHIAASYASNIGGALDTVTGDYSNITSSYGSTVTGEVSAILGGEGNSITSDISAIAGGYLDSIESTWDGFIGGGAQNVVKDEDGAIAGGELNIAYLNSFVGGGIANHAGAFSHSSSAVLGGSHNTAAGDNSIVAGGQDNMIPLSAIYSGVLAGVSNYAGGSNTAIVGGGYLRMTGNNSFGFHAGSSSNDSASISTGNTAYFGNVNVWLGNTNNTPSQLRFYGGQNGGVNFPSASTHYSGFAAAGQTADINYTLPSSSPGANGNLLLATSGNSSTMAWSSNLVWDNTNYRLGINTNSPAHSLHSVYSGTNDEYAAVYGNATGSTANQAVGIWGDASNTSGTNTGTIGVLATGNGNGTEGTTNVALQVNDGEFTMGRTTEMPGAGTIVENAAGGSAYSAQGPSGVVELTLGAAGNLATSAPTAGAIQDLGSVTINNRYCELGSIVLTNVVAMIDDGVAPNPQNAAWIVNVDNTTGGSFVLRIKMIPTSTSASNYSTSDKIHIGYMIVNKSK